MKLAVVSLVFLVGCQFELLCPGDFAPLPGVPAGHVYLAVPQLGTWSQQFNFCKRLSASAYLAVPEDFTELMNLAALATEDAFWVGIDDRATEGVYISAETGGPAPYLPWSSVFPMNASDNTDCVVATATEIVAVTCNSGQLPVVCECNP